MQLHAPVASRLLAQHRLYIHLLRAVRQLRRGPGSVAIVANRGAGPGLLAGRDLEPGQLDAAELRAIDHVLWMRRGQA